MNVSPITPESLAASVIAVPPLARDDAESPSPEENQKLIDYLQAAGIATLLYGGNAVFYHVLLTEYADLLELLMNAASDDTTVIPSAGPAYGVMMEQAWILKDYEFPTAMILPQREIMTPTGVARAVRRFVDTFCQPIVLYIKHDGYVEVDQVRGLMNDGLLSAIKYAVVRDDPAEDPFLRSLVDAVGPERIISGIGEQPAPTHMRQFGLSSFTSGCVCVAPRLSLRMLAALQAGEDDKAERIRQTFEPLEDLRNRINPIRVLHAAVALAGLAETGPLIPLLSAIDEADAKAVRAAAVDLKAAEDASATIA